MEIRSIFKTYMYVSKLVSLSINVPNSADNYEVSGSKCGEYIPVPLRRASVRPALRTNVDNNSKLVRAKIDAVCNIAATLMEASWCGQRIIMKSADQSVVSTSPCLCDGLQCAQLSVLMLTTIVVNIGAGQG